MDVSTEDSNSIIAQTYYKHVDMVYRICFMFLRNVPDTEDAVQSVFLKFIQSGKAFTDPEHEKAWLIVTAQNHCKNMLKFWWRRKRFNLADLPESTQNPNSNEVFEQLIALPYKYRTVLYLYYYEGYSSKEIAELLGINDSTIRTQLRVGRKQFKLQIQEGKI
ncbi:MULTISPECIES: sigma-70 family RNA polymerase sigma factor [unclassified Paenibacillus]|uniref:RNA polymerase sigma factor n=1 Tax=unclassified Paenibacillus TaxID=185978 RepID=UPI002404D09A|nr:MULTISPECIES: sigma-70 family RNA polymerase sigma factor [unclassified Paenibacillus]MDF9841621.1 RNA polymerase sigma factor (sigma-70 family) [Paenibacillus sp. PastF-2]MDF9848267.1 RNA polymerase sigma factor (sigma-70 family) [Paenibacillus sp. PastM-2]MDF9854780.1 RNA polymerase sigma factor (sigma-70 family) [Paenibacillus sp. PastF-1]MDH6480050.1 RNA polymerase sigma factor (sigma-70 family) [Paenibacillus sp. PastH-2]MDH6507483.1 RNA polymerase sigma factor (sigma-70 family) [Paeni